MLLCVIQFWLFCGWDFVVLGRHKYRSPDFDTRKINIQLKRRVTSAVQACATTFSLFVTRRTLGGGLSPMAENNLYAFPLISVRTHMVVELTFTGTALTS